MNIIEAAEKAGMTRLPADHQCRVPYWDVVIDSELERFAQIIRNQALEDAAKCCIVEQVRLMRVATKKKKLTTLQ